MIKYYLSSAKDAAKAAEAAVFASYRERVRAVDPDAVAADGTIIGRNAASGELEPNATRTTGYFGEPTAAVQGFVIPVPEEAELQLDDPAAVGVEPVAHINPWPALAPGGAPPPLPAWVQPTGAHDAYPLDMWVSHKGATYCSLLATNVWEPSPESNYWRISPDPGPLPWKAPSGAMDAYMKTDRVTHVVAGRETDLWESNIDANTTEPGTDGTFDRWWKPILDAGGELQPWVEPVPGDGSTLYEIEDEVLKDGKRWKSKAHLNAFEPGIMGWEEMAAP